MKKVVVVTLTLAVCAGFLYVASAQEKAVQQEEKKPMPFELNATEWEVTLTSVVEGEAKPEIKPDTLTFESGKFVSQEFERRGYEPASFAVALKGKKTVWTSALRKASEVVYWRGDFRDKAMRGMVSVQKVDGTLVKDYSFIGKMVKGSLKEVVPVEEMPVEEAQEVTTPAGEETLASQEPVEQQEAAPQEVKKEKKAKETKQETKKEKKKGLFF